MNDSLGIYISFPFCKAKCSFCNFASGVFSADRMQGYVDRVCEELRQARARALSLPASLPNRVDTVYFGGGTPSLLEPMHLSQIFHALRAEFDLDADAEITLEAAPGQVSDETLEAARRLGINRVSFGVQSFIDAELASVGRLHTRAECHAEFARMRSAGVERVSLDLIAGLPKQTATSWHESVEEALASGVDHISIYMLEVDEDSRLGREALAGGRRYHADTLPSDDATADWYLAACERLAAAGVAQYEISNFARPGFQSRHNLKYWSRQPYLGLGLDAHSMLRCERPGSQGAFRWANPDDFEDYMGGSSMNRQDPRFGMVGNPPRSSIAEIDRIDASQAFEETLFLGLRLNQGVDLERLRDDFGSSRVNTATNALHDVEVAGLVRRSASRISLTAAGRLASNEVFSRLLAA